ncbi:uncharacterized protein LOC119723809 isoform X2 [Patiria miniata]|nr:uncharacterized protein LOC119723809 isoform X2 [Patiria miniata]
MFNQEQEESPAFLESYTKLVPLPCDQPGWCHLKATLARLATVTTPHTLLPCLGEVYRAAHPSQHNWHTVQPLAETPHPFLGLGHFLEHVAEEAEQDQFFRRVLPTITWLAGEMEAWRPQEGIQYALQQQESTVCLDRRFVASVVANAFLCTFPKQHSLRVNSINFDEFFQFLICSSTKSSQTAKLRCFLNYFDRLADIDVNKSLTGHISYIRQVLKEDETISLEEWLDSKTPLCPLTIKHEGLIENAGSHALQVDFANRFLGGSILLAGRQQEEIRFSTCPELLASLLFTESLQDNEAVVVTGFEQFSEYSGYSSTLKFTGDHKDYAKKNECGDLINTLIAIDAMPWSGYLQNQYKPEHIFRELNKAYVGFCYPKASVETSVSIGQEEVDSGSYHDALDQSLVSTDGADFETASSGDDHSCESFSNSTLQAFGSSLSRAITDIAIKDVTGSFQRPSLPRDESSQNSLSTVLMMSNNSTPVDEVSQMELPGIPGELPALESYATGLVQDVLKEAGANRFEEAGSQGVGVTEEDGEGDATLQDENLELHAEMLVNNIISNAVVVVKETNEQQIPDESDAGYDKEHNRDEPSELIQVIDNAAFGTALNDIGLSESSTTLTSPQKHSEPQHMTESHSGESRSSKGSLADYSVISSASGQSSDSFVKLNGDVDLGYRQRHPNQAFSTEVLAADIMHDALATLHKHFNIRSGIPTTISNDSLDFSEIHSEMSMARDRSGSFDILTSGDVSSSPSLSEYVRVSKFSLDGLAEDVMSSAFQQLQQILQEKAIKDLNGNQKKETIPLSSDVKDNVGNPLNNNNEASDYKYLTLAQEDVKNGNTLPSSIHDAVSQEGHQRPCTANNFAERLVGEVFNESLHALQNRNLVSSRGRHHEDPSTPPPSPTDPVELEASVHTSQSIDKSLVTISEQPAIEEPLYFGDKRLSVDSSGTESSQSREARIRECAEQLVARTLPESMKLLGGSAQTTSSSSSRRTSSPRGSIPNSSNRSSMDCFTEDLLKIGNIDPMGKRPSRTEESLAFFAQEIKRMAEAEEKSSKKQKEDFADFTMELQRGSARAQPDENTATSRHSLEMLADRYSVQVVSDVFVQLYGEPWSEAIHSVEQEDEIVQQDAVKDQSPCHPSEQDLMTMASNLANSIIEAALTIYREEHLHVPVHAQVNAGNFEMGTVYSENEHSSLEEAVDDVRMSNKNLRLEEFASTTGHQVIQKAFADLPNLLRDIKRVEQERDEEVGPAGQRPISTGNWGCGAFGGDPQLKSLIQWMTASHVGCPRMMYYSFGDERVSRLQRVVSEITSRQWTVGDLLRAVLDHSWLTLNVDADPLSLFERIINSG